MRIDSVGTGAVAQQGGMVRPGQSEFFQLLVTQLRYQDPINPIEDRDFIAQLAQFSMLEELQSLNRSQALAMLDRGVVFKDRATGDILAGVVQSVQLAEGRYHLMVDGRQVSLDDVCEVWA